MFAVRGRPDRGKERAPPGPTAGGDRTDSTAGSGSGAREVTPRRSRRSATRTPASPTRPSSPRTASGSTPRSNPDEAPAVEALLAGEYWWQGHAAGAHRTRFTRSRPRRVGARAPDGASHRLGAGAGAIVALRLDLRRGGRAVLARPRHRRAGDEATPRPPRRAQRPDRAARHARCEGAVPGLGLRGSRRGAPPGHPRWCCTAPPSSGDSGPGRESVAPRCAALRGYPASPPLFSRSSAS